ncbi:hypothetical protein LF1_15630 [Rubripirellula obstinata]|uniref:Uncharacterized protein n=1 Tax=Rubripirellula obstinata TaxID=406547 RepID=A0A5B1CD00_9BACT|nr:hypothetical protein LF1_15630 [Rubripirellula obstinata]
MHLGGLVFIPVQQAGGRHIFAGASATGMIETRTASPEGDTTKAICRPLGYWIRFFRGPVADALVVIHKSGVRELRLWFGLRSPKLLLT